MKKTRKYDIALIVLLSLISESDFISYLLGNITGKILDIVLRIAFIVYVIFKIRKGFGSFNFNKPKAKVLLLLPIFVICFSNLFVVLYEHQEIKGDYIFEPIEFTKIILTVLCEELTFRVVLFEEIRKYNNPLKSILISSMIFGLAHLANISSFGSIPYCLIQSVYSFGVGLILSFMYLYSDNFIFPVLFHFLFNFMNDNYVTKVYMIDWTAPFFLINIGIGLVIGIYILLLFRGEKYVSKTMDN